MPLCCVCLSLCVSFMFQQHLSYNDKVFNVSNKLRALNLGQDRYKRRYWVLPQLGGVFVEGMETAEISDSAECDVEQVKRDDIDDVQKEEKNEQSEISVKTEILVVADTQKEIDSNMKKEIDSDVRKEAVNDSTASCTDTKQDREDKVVPENKNKKIPYLTANPHVELPNSIHDLVGRVVETHVKALNGDLEDTEKPNSDKKHDVDKCPVIGSESKYMDLKFAEGIQKQSEHASVVNKSSFPKYLYQNGDISDRIHPMLNGDIEMPLSASNKLCNLAAGKDSVSVTRTETVIASAGLDCPRKPVVNGDIAAVAVDNDLRDFSKGSHKESVKTDSGVAEFLDVTKSIKTEPLTDVKPSVDKSPAEACKTSSATLNTPSFRSIDSMLSPDSKQGKAQSTSLPSRSLFQNSFLTPSTSSTSLYLNSAKLYKDTTPTSSSEGTSQTKQKGTWISVLPRTSCDQLLEGKGQMEELPWFMPPVTTATTTATFRSPVSGCSVVTSTPHMSPMVTSSAMLHRDASTASLCSYMSDSSFASAPQTPSAQSATPTVPGSEDETYALLVAQLRELTQQEPRAVDPVKKHGWWKITNIDALKELMHALHLRGIRERSLQKTIEKYFDYCRQSIGKDRTDGRYIIVYIQ